MKFIVKLFVLSIAIAWNEYHYTCFKGNHSYHGTGTITPALKEITPIMERLPLHLL